MNFCGWRWQDEKYYQIIHLPILVCILDVCSIVFVRLGVKSMYQVTVFDKFDCVSFVEEFDELEEAKEEASRFKNTLIEEVEEDITEQLLDILPHGSGINF